MEQKKQSTINFSIFWHNFTRTFPRLFWLPLLLCLGLGAWRYWRSLKSFVPVYEVSTIYRVTGSKSGSMDITTARTRRIAGNMVLDIKPINFSFFFDFNCTSWVLLSPEI